MLLPIFYLPPISWFASFLSNENIQLEQWENFPKQTYRNRANIYGANGKLSLIIPIKHTGKRVFNEIQISYTEDWQKLHWKSIKTAYQSSPYFEYYEEKLKEIFTSQETSLMKFNLKALEIIKTLIKSDKGYTLTEDYIKNPDSIDLRDSFSAKKIQHKEYSEYYQVFSDKMGFIEDLSILDLLCNKGPEAYSYIMGLVEKQEKN